MKTIPKNPIQFKSNSPLNSKLDTFQLSSQTMRCKTKNNKDIRKKEENAISQALYLARKLKKNPNYETNNTVSSIVKESKDSKLVHSDEKRFSPTSNAFNYTFGNDEDTKRDILIELNTPNLTKTRTKKLKKQLRDINTKIENSKLIDVEKLDAEIQARNLLELNK